MATTLMFWNLYEAGHDAGHGDWGRWHDQVQVVRRLRPDILCITEGWRWDQDDSALFRRALTDFGYRHGHLHLAKTGCHMAVMWNDPLELVEVTEQRPSEAWWHGFYRVILTGPDLSTPLTVVGSHMNPFDPTLRRIEASWLRIALPVDDHGVLVMDANTVGVGDPEPEPALNTHFPGSELIDRVPTELLAAAGLRDVGAEAQDRTPTVGHFVGAERGAVKRRMRLDQAWVTPSVQVRDYRVVDDLVTHPELDRASDHRPVWLCVH